MSKTQARKELAQVDETIERIIASVHGYLTADIIERRSHLRRILGIDDS